MASRDNENLRNQITTMLENIPRAQDGPTIPEMVRYVKWHEIWENPNIPEDMVFYTRAKRLSRIISALRREAFDNIIRSQALTSKNKNNNNNNDKNKLNKDND